MLPEKDFDLYLGWGAADWSSVVPPVDTAGTPPVDTPPAEVIPPVDAAWDQVAKIEEMAAWADAWTDVWTEAPAGWEDLWGEATSDDLQKMLDSLDVSSEEAAWASEEIKKTAEEIKASVSETDTESQVKIDELISKLAEKEANEIKLQKTIDVLKSEYEKTLNDKISLEYGTASDSRIVQLINDDPDVKALLAAKMADGEWASEKISNAWKSWWENISWQKIEDIVAWNKKAEVDALTTTWEDAWIDMAWWGDGLYL